MRKTWQLQDAKNRLSEVVEAALHSGSQTITRRGVPVVAVIAVSELRELRSRQGSLVDFLRASPMSGVEMDVRRERDLPRDIDL